MDLHKVNPFLMVRVTGLEPAHLSAPEPKSGVSANFTTPAKPYKLYHNKNKMSIGKSKFF